MDALEAAASAGGARAEAAARCENVFEVAEALTCAADRVGGYWFSTQGPGENRSWQVGSRFSPLSLLLSLSLSVSFSFSISLSFSLS